MNLFIYSIIFLLPLYLVKFKIGFVPFNVLELIIWLVFGAWLIKGKLREIRRIVSLREIPQREREIRAIVVPSLLILIGAIFSTLLSQDILVSTGILKGWFLAPMALALMVYTEVRDEKNIKQFICVLFASATVVAIIALIYYAFGRLTFDNRLSAFYLSPNHLAMYLAPGFLIGIGLLGLKSPPAPLLQRGVRFILFVSLILIAVALYLTFSYAAWIAVLIVVSGQWLVTSGKRRTLIYAFILLILIAVLFFSQFGSEKFNNLLNSERSSWQSRLMIWKAALEIIKDQPVFGIGPGEFGKYYLAYQSQFAIPYLEWAVPQPHNIFLAFWLQTGLLGLIGFLWLLAVFFVKILKQAGVTFSCCGTRRPAASSDSPRCENATPACFYKQNQLALVLAGLMVYILLHGLVDTTYWKNDLAIIFWVIIAISAVLCYKRVLPLVQ